MTPIDDSPMPPPPSKETDKETLTQDLVSAIEREAMSIVDFVAHQQGIGRRAATPIVLQMLRDLKKPKTEGDR